MRQRLPAAVACLIACPLIAQAAPEAHAKDANPITVTITSVQADGVEPSSRATVKAKVRNTSGAAVYGVQALLWRSRDAITDLSTLRDVPTTINGWGAALPITDAHYSWITKSSTAFPAGGSRDITLSATLDELGFGTHPAVYPLGIRVIGASRSSSASGLVGQARTFLTLPPQGTTVPVTPVVVLAATPTKITADLFANDSLAAQLSDRLGGLLDAAIRGEASYLIDPALLDEVSDMADGYTVRSRRGNRPGTGQAVAAAWLARFRSLPSGDGARTLFANPDLSWGGPARVARAVKADAGELGDLPLFGLTATGVMTETLARSLASAAPSALLATNLSHSALVQAAQLNTSTVAITATSLNEVSAAGDLLARTAVSDGQVRIIRDADDVKLNTAAWTSWMRRAPLRELLGRTPTATGGYTKADEPTLSPGQRTVLRLATRNIPLYDHVVPEAQLRDGEDAVLTRLASSSWIGDLRGQESYADAVFALADVRSLRAVTLNVSPRVVMSSKANEFPVTVTNGLKTPVNVKIVTTTNNPGLVVPDSDVVEIPPGVSQTVSVRPEATTNGVTTAYVDVASPNGLSITGRTPVTVEVTDLGFIAWIVVVASGALLVGATAFRVRQVAHGQARHPVRPAPDADDLPEGAELEDDAGRAGP